MIAVDLQVLRETGRDNLSSGNSSQLPITRLLKSSSRSSCYPGTQPEQQPKFFTLEETRK
jgi:hypothetical protein